MLDKEIRYSVNELIDRFKTVRVFNVHNTVEQISYLILMKRFEIVYQNIPEQYKWSKYRDHIWNDEGLRHINYEILPYIKDFLIGEGKEAIKGEKFKLDDFFLDNHQLLISLISLIDYIYDRVIEQSKIQNNQAIQIIEGELFEYMLIQTLGKDMYAKFDIQKHLAQFVMNLLDPDIHKTVADLACGTGGILISAYEYLITKYSDETFYDENGLEVGLDGNKLTSDQKEYLTNNSLVGFTNDNFMAFLSTMNTIMHGLNSKVIILDSLSPRYDEYISDKKFDYIVSNPPFGLKTNRNFSIARRYKISSIELLFLLRISESLKEGGEAAVIIPEGVLFNKSKPYVKTRQFLMENCKVEGVISFPAGLFQPFTVVKTSLLILRKGGSDKSLESIWFYDMKSDGYSLDSKRQKLNENPLPEIIKLWRHRADDFDKAQHSNSFWISYKEIIENEYDLSIDSYKQSFEAISHENPDDLLEELFSLEIDINRNLDYLREARIK